LVADEVLTIRGDVKLVADEGLTKFHEDDPNLHNAK